MNFHRFKLIILFTIGSLFVSCDKENTCVKTSGDTITEERAVSQSFENIELNDKINLIIRQDSVFSLKVVGGANLMPLITTEVAANQLIIKSDNKCSFLRSYDEPINVFLSVPNLKKITYKGQGNISSGNMLVYPDFTIESDKGTGSINLSLTTNNLRILQHTGPADFTVVGSSKYTYLYTNGNGWFYFENFSSDDTHVNTAGTGDAIVRSNNNLLVELYAIGNVYYYGNPTLTVSHHTGSGEVKKR
ncbi:MAG: DUF2807 domain-containing protein [Bacteroidetes bacterium]|nr:DUF2807 domain-containing protein [Bacteroidota bacterium]